jgi:hypothetical protein
VPTFPLEVEVTPFRERGPGDARSRRLATPKRDPAIVDYITTRTVDRAVEFGDGALGQMSRSGDAGPPFAHSERRDTRRPGGSLSTAERMIAGGNSREDVPRLGEGSEMSPPGIRPRPGGHQPVAEGALLVGILLLLEGCAKACAARIIGGGVIPRLLDHRRGDVHGNGNMRAVGRAEARGLTVPADLKEGKRPHDQE